MAVQYGDDIMGAIASLITNLTVVYSTVYSNADRRKHQSSASLAFVRGIPYVVILWEICSPHDDVIKWKHFPRYWLFVRGIHRSPVNSPHKGQWRGALMFTLICARINGWVNNREAGHLRRYRAHYDVIVMHYEWRHISKIAFEITNIRSASIFRKISSAILNKVCESWWGTRPIL